MKSEHLTCSTTVLHDIVFKRQGENATTSPDPHCTLADAKANGLNLDKVENYCMSYDNDMLTPCKVYSARAIELPSWLPVAEWLQNTTSWRYTWHAIGCPMTASEKLQRLLNGMHSGSGLALLKLLNTGKFRSAFRQSLRTQVDTWLDGKGPAFASPLSQGQLNAITTTHDDVEYKRAAQGLYNRR